ncbi:c-type cytochrome [Shewanella gelidimarina]|uniref:cytochrome c n=1 Tax=Shewanella gelidimarina TaxID=56813 RepID=UPI00200CC3FB|nr:cytochrome c [Shewanella gelidimarina]MCL1056761.1 c-type cytochrome [Shewanella gelidimarina]
MKKLIIIGLALGLAAVIFIYFGSGKLANVASAAHQSETVDIIVERGRQVAIESDCVACHTGPSGAPFAGGVAFDSPFGMIYSTNITPDKQYGIGLYQREDFYRAVKWGYSSKVGNLYPAMPFTSYRKLNDEDLDALWAYFQSIKPIAEPNSANDLIFPANIRFFLGGWNQLFFDDSDFINDTNRSEQWNKGKYFVEAAGHCGECHTPRNLLFAMQPDKALQGEFLEGWQAGDITAKELKSQGWNAKDLVDLLKMGESRKGSTYENMYLVVNHSLSHMPNEDLAAISGYLLDKDQVSIAEVTGSSDLQPIERVYLSQEDKTLSGYQTYVDYCAGCHGLDGLGKPEAVVALHQNSAFTAQSPYNSIAVILRGLPSKRQSQTRGVVSMSSFNAQVSDQQVAELVNFARQVWGAQKDAKVNNDMVKEIREKLDKEGYLNHLQMKKSD